MPGGRPPGAKGGPADYAARCAVAKTQELAEQAGPTGEHDVPRPTVHQFAAMDLVSSGELAADEVRDEAVDSAVLSGLLALQEARTASDPSTAAEICLSASPTSRSRSPWPAPTRQSRGCWDNRWCCGFPGF